MKIPAQAGIFVCCHSINLKEFTESFPRRRESILAISTKTDEWIPACAGMTP